MTYVGVNLPGQHVDLVRGQLRQQLVHVHLVVLGYLLGAHPLHLLLPTRRHGFCRRRRLKHTKPIFNLKIQVNFKLNYPRIFY